MFAFGGPGRAVTGLVRVAPRARIIATAPRPGSRTGVEVPLPAGADPARPGAWSNATPCVVQRRRFRLTITYLPEMRGMRNQTRGGRNVYEGYQRGWGLQYGDLSKQVLADPLYRESLKLAAGRTVQVELRRMNIFLILKYFLSRLDSGHVIEFGSYKGGSALFMANVCARLHPGVMVYALDTYGGMPPTDKAVDAHSAGDFADVELDELRAFAESKGLSNIRFVKGRFEETAGAVLEEAKRVVLAHIDCDIRSSVAYAYDATRPYLVPGAYVVLDDATESSCMGATEVVEEIIIRRDGLSSEQIFPQFVFRYPPL
jgi:hypothetical protein